MSLVFNSFTLSHAKGGMRSRQRRRRNINTKTILLRRLITVRPIISGTNNIILSESLSNASNQAIYNIYGIKVATYPKEIDNLLPGIYIVNGKKIVIK